MLAMNYKVLWCRRNFYLTVPLHLYLEKSICLPELLYKGGGQLCAWTKKGKMGLKAYLTEWNQWTKDDDLHSTKYLVTCSIIKPYYCILPQFQGWPNKLHLLCFASIYFLYLKQQCWTGYCIYLLYSLNESDSFGLITESQKGWVLKGPLKI